MAAPASQAAAQNAQSFRPSLRAVSMAARRAADAAAMIGYSSFAAVTRRRRAQARARSIGLTSFQVLVTTSIAAGESLRILVRNWSTRGVCGPKIGFIRLRSRKAAPGTAVAGQSRWVVADLGRDRSPGAAKMPAGFEPRAATA